MADLNHTIGSDLSLSNTGDIATVTGDGETRQRVLRRLITNPGAYIWNPTYGGGLPAMVGEVTDAGIIEGVIVQQMGMEATVAASPVPAVSIVQDPAGAIAASVTYTDATSGQTQVLNVPTS